MSTGNPLFLRDEDLDDAILMIERAQRLVASDVADALDHLSLGATHDLVLRLVARRPGVAMVELKRTIAASKQTLSRVISELEAKGLVQLEQRAADRRQRPARITETGRALLAELDQLRRRRLRRAFRMVGPEAVGGFRQVLEMLLDPRAEPAAQAAQRSLTTS
ncbi:MarR family winged helix-turn-helix transcriptional regulator [Geminicoccus roseus]|uniref:MarR family winged helix-turn-helix transcriptional regulator n=1 Tax=Geminicoccus roseus TaxID=404900 RepID=UPI0003F84C21|nr:MarR family transcriptional regulator [Geminicoccus roseus]